jgi:hypothetical protein
MNALSKDGEVDAKALSVVKGANGESLGMSFSQDFEDYAGEGLDKFL